MTPEASFKKMAPAFDLCLGMWLDRRKVEMHLVQGNNIIRESSYWNNIIRESSYLKWGIDDCEAWEIILDGYKRQVEV